MTSILFALFFGLIYIGMGFAIYSIVFKTWSRPAGVPHPSVYDVDSPILSPEQLYSLARATTVTLWPVYLLIVPIMILVKKVKKDD